MSNQSKRRDKFSPLTIVMLLLLALYSIVLLVLLLWAVMQVFKHPRDFRNDPIWFPELKKFTLANFQAIMQYSKGMVRGIQFGGILNLYMNSFIFALGGAIVNVTVTCLTAYLVARYDFLYSKIIYATVILVMVIPIVGAQASEIVMLNKLNLYDKRFTFVVLKASFVGIYFLVFYETFKGIPKSYSEAAMMDGAGFIGIMFKICFPLAVNVFTTILLITFVQYWNDYQLAYLYMPHYPTLSYYLFIINQTNGGDRVTVNGEIFYMGKQGVKMAAVMLTMLPILVLFLLLHKKLMSNVSIGGIKG